MKLTNEETLNMVAESLTNGKVGYYWETGDSYPVIEVFMTDNKYMVELKKKDVKHRLADLGMTQLDVDMENLDFMGNDDDYHRIMIYFSFKNITDNDLINMIDILKDYGTEKI